MDLSASFLFLGSWVGKQSPQNAKPLIDSYLTGSRRRKICFFGVPSWPKKIGKSIGKEKHTKNVTNPNTQTKDADSWIEIWDT